jgi:hypothetical protein
MLVLMYEVLKDKESFFSPYLDILPTSFDTLILWPLEDLRELQDASREEDITTEQVYRKAQREDLLTRLKSQGLNTLASQISLPLYLWAHAVSSTRCFELNNTLQHILVPFADLLNHHPESPTTWREESGTFVMSVDGGGFERGTQVFNNYGGDQR